MTVYTPKYGSSMGSNGLDSKVQVADVWTANGVLTLCCFLIMNNTNFLFSFARFLVVFTDVGICTPLTSCETSQAKPWWRHCYIGTSSIAELFQTIELRKNSQISHKLCGNSHFLKECQSRERCVECLHSMAPCHAAFPSASWRRPNGKEARFWSQEKTP